MPLVDLAGRGGVVGREEGRERGERERQRWRRFGARTTSEDSGGDDAVEAVGLQLLRPLLLSGKKSIHEVRVRGRECHGEGACQGEALGTQSRPKEPLWPAAPAPRL